MENKLKELLDIQELSSFSFFYSNIKEERCGNLLIEGEISNKYFFN